MTNQERMERIELPEELERVILEAVKTGMRKKKQAIWKRVGLGCMGVAAAFAVLVSAGFVSPVAARAFEGIPALGKVFTYLYDLAGYDGRYAQIAGDARPAITAGQKEAGGQDFRQEEGMGGEAGQQEATERQGAAGQQESAGFQEADGQQGEETVQNAVTASDAGVTITIKEYFCDKRSLYLSMMIESEEPFVEGELEANTEGTIFLFTREEVLSYEGADSIPVGNSALGVDGVYLDSHTFVGIARCEWLDVKRESLAVPDELTYTAIIQHLKVYPHDAYVQNAVLDLRAEWKFSMEICCDEDAAEVLPVNVTGEDGSMIREVRLLPYELQVVTESGTTGSTLTMEEKMLIAFDGQGNILDWAGSLCSFSEDDKEVFGYVRPEDLDGLELFVVDEYSWMDHWKGNLYNGNMTGPEMVEFLKKNAIMHAAVNCVR